MAWEGRATILPRAAEVWRRVSSGCEHFQEFSNGLGNASQSIMITGPVSNLSYIRSVFATSFSRTGSTNNTSGASAAAQSDSSQLSPFAQILSTLQQLQQSNPVQYRTVTQQIATNLQTAAQTAQAAGNTTAATQLNQLANDFTSASGNGQLPNVQDLAQAAGGLQHHHRHHHGSSNSDSSSGSSTSSVSASLLAAFQNLFQNNKVQSNSLDPMTIISNTLSGAS